MLLVAVAIVMVNAMLMIFGPDARNVQLDYQLESFEIGKILIDKARLYAAGRGGRRGRGTVLFFRFTATGKAIRACADNYLGAKVVGLNVKKLYALHLRPGLGLRRGRGLRDGAAGGRHAAARARTTPCSPSSSSSSAAWAR